jgi:hypothetical protein
MENRLHLINLALSSQTTIVNLDSPRGYLQAAGG